MLFFVISYFVLGALHQLCEYSMYWARGSWAFERQTLRDFNVELGSPFKGHELESMMQRHIFEIRKMVFYSTITWPLTFGRVFYVKAGSPLDEYTRRRMLVALFRSLGL